MLGRPGGAEMSSTSLIKRYYSHPTVKAVEQYVQNNIPLIPVQHPTDSDPQSGKAPVHGFSIHNPLTTISEVRKRWGHCPSWSVAIPTGSVSGLIVLDIDPRHGGEESLAELQRECGPLPDTVECQTGGGGRHLYFQAPNRPVGCRINLKPGLDLKGDGGYVVAPPSVHQSGDPYEWSPARSIIEYELAPLPDCLFQAAELPEQTAGRSVASTSPTSAARDTLIDAAKQYLANVDEPAEGERNQTIFNLAGHMHAFVIRASGERLEEQDICSLLTEWNSRNSNPLPESEIRAAVRSAMINGTPREDHPISTDDLAAKQTSIAKALMVLGDGEDVELFHGRDQMEAKSSASVYTDGTRFTYPVRSTTFERWLRKRYWELFQSGVNDNAMTEALNTLDAKARFAGAEYSVSTRIGGDRDRAFLDLGDQSGQVVVIENGDWYLTSLPEWRFFRTKTMKSLPTPVKPGDARRLRTFLNITSSDQWALVVTWLLSALCPNGPYPILVLQGEKGSGKSTASRLLQRLVDPHAAKLRSAPESVRDLMISAKQCHLLAYDNFSGISNRLSDAFCRLATGGSYTTRELYTNDEEMVINATRPILINGIDDFVSRSDFLDRAIVVEFPEIEDDHRRTEDELDDKFDQCQGEILGGLLSALADALYRLPGIEMDQTSRMADFEKLGRAGEWSLGLPPRGFLKAYRRSRKHLSARALEASPIGQAVLSLMTNYKKWEGTASELLEELNERPENRDVKKRTGWPRAASWLSNGLKRIEPDLRSEGLWMKKRRTSGGKQRVIELWWEKPA
jgi:hypothetical protein